MLVRKLPFKDKGGLVKFIFKWKEKEERPKQQFLIEFF
jgi:hypothetical protein